MFYTLGGWINEADDWLGTFETWAEEPQICHPCKHPGSLPQLDGGVGYIFFNTKKLTACLC